MLNLPMRVSFITSAADMAQTIASQCSRRAFSAGSTGRKWSSMNSIVTMTMSPRRDVGQAALQRRAVGAPFAGGMHRQRQARQLARQLRLARSAALARWLSIVTSTTRIGVAGRVSG